MCNINIEHSVFFILTAIYLVPDRVYQGLFAVALAGEDAFLKSLISIIEIETKVSLAYLKSKLK